MGRALWLSILCLNVAPLFAQTTHGIVTGRVFDRQSNAGIPGAIITYTSLDTNETGSVRTSAQGTYAIAFLPPGRYRVRADSPPDYQSQTLQRMELQVAGRVELNFPLRSYAELRRGGVYNGGSVSLAGQREVVNFFGPDVGFAAPLQVLDPKSDTLQPSLSYVISSAEINGLPLRGRDVYSLLLTVPGATSDTATARSLGLSINGQRPSSSNFLLDGVENNDTLNTGTRIQVAPEVVESYRASTNNFSAEFGRTSGFVANAVTRAGSNQLHGTIYSYLGNDIFNANSFQNNIRGLSRRPDRQVYAGFWAGGPVRLNRLWFSTGFEKYRRRGNNDPQIYDVPGALAMSISAPNSDASTLLQKYASPGSDQNAIALHITLAPPVAVDQVLLLERLDYRSKSGSDRLTGRLAIARQSQPAFVFSPFKDFTSGSGVNSGGITIDYLHTLGAAMVNDFRLDRNSAEQTLDRAHPEIPTLQSFDGTLLPSSPLLRASQDRATTWELSNSLVWIRGRHIVTAGGGYELNQPSFSNTFGQTGYFSFNSVGAFLFDTPGLVGFAASRQALPRLALPDLARSYRNHQFFGFVQDNFKLTNRIGLSIGIRYDSFGSLKNVAIQDSRFRAGSGSSIEERIANASISQDSTGQNSIYAPDRNNWSGRLGLSYDLKGDGATIFRGGLGIYYDRPYGLLVQSIQFNDVDFRYAILPLQPLNYLRPFRGAFPGLVGSPGPDDLLRSFSGGFPDFYWIDANLRTPHVQTWFAGIQRKLRKDLTLEISNTGALGRKLVASDIVNRPFSASPVFGNSSGLLNPDLPPGIIYRSNSGSSNYLALSGIARYRGTHGVVQVSYTYSHSIDNQSDALLGQFTGLTADRRVLGVAAYTRQFDSRIDRANSDFDQRQNLVFYSLYDLPKLSQRGLLGHLLSGWQTSQLGAFRTGFPFTVLAPGGVNPLLNNRADLIRDNPKSIEQDSAPGGRPIPGGRLLLDRSAFAEPGDAVGTLGRNSLAGPGFFSVDASISKSFAVPKFGETARVSIRADLFNVLNHTNLGNPDSLLKSATFGIAQFGRTTRSSPSLLVAPLDETPRQVQFQLKVVF